MLMYLFTILSRHLVCILTGHKSLKPNSEIGIDFRFFSWIVRKILEEREARGAHHPYTSGRLWGEPNFLAVPQKLHNQHPMLWLLQP